MSDMKPWAVFVQPPSEARQSFNQNDMVKAMTGHMTARADAILEAFKKSGMEDQIEILDNIPILHMISVRATDAAVEKLKTLKDIVHSVESNIFTAPMPEEDRRLLDERRQKGAKPNQGGNKGPRP